MCCFEKIERILTTQSMPRDRAFDIMRAAARVVRLGGLFTMSLAVPALAGHVSGEDYWLSWALCHGITFGRAVGLLTLGTLLFILSRMMSNRYEL